MLKDRIVEQSIKLGIYDKKGGDELLKNLHIILSITVISLAGYGLITRDFKFQPYMMLLLSLTMLVMGIREFQKGNKGYGWLGIVTFLFVFFVSIQTFFLNGGNN
jgi:hypothetical protein